MWHTCVIYEGRRGTDYAAEFASKTCVTYGGRKGRKEGQYVYYAIEDIIAIVLKGTCHIQCHVFGWERILDFAINSRNCSQVERVELLNQVHVLYPLHTHAWDNYSIAHVKGKRYTRVSRRLHAGYTQIDNTSHARDHLGARGLHACYTQHATRVWKSTPMQPTEVFVL